MHVVSPEPKSVSVETVAADSDWQPVNQTTSQPVNQ